MQHEELKIDPAQLRAEAEKEPPRHGLSQYAEVITLLKQDKGFSFREIAHHFDCTEDAAKKRAQRALRRLRQMLS